jgi:hypothetical protein
LSPVAIPYASQILGVQADACGQKNQLWDIIQCTGKPENRGDGQKVQQQYSVSNVVVVWAVTVPVTGQGQTPLFWAEPRVMFSAYAFLMLMVVGGCPV